MDIPIPYNLTEEDLKLEPYPERAYSWRRNLELLADPELGFDGDQLDRILTSAILLRHKLPNAHWDQCLETAILWERG